jgi:hypothetical protein
VSGTYTLSISTPLWYTVIMAKIPLFGKRGIGKFALVDEDDVELVAGIRWHVNDMGYAVNRKNGTTVRMHRLINKTPNNLFTDHKNGKTLDNRRSNLRTVTTAENAQNNHKAKGYTWDESKQKFMVRYRKQFYGRYKTEAEAKRAYQLACSGVPYAKRIRRQNYHLPTGVFKNRSNRGYQAKLQLNGERIYLGTFETKEDAEKAYLKRKRG